MTIDLSTLIVRSPKYRLYALLALCGVAMSFASVKAHNGAIAVAAPTSGIVVDGDLSDWSPSTATAPGVESNLWNMPSPTSGFHSIAHKPRQLQHVQYGDPPVDAVDFSATSQIAYDSERQILYVAVQTSDQSVWIDTTAGSRWNNQDGCDIYLALHDTAATMVRQYSIYGDKLALGSGTDVEYAVALTDSSASYEWSLDLAKVFGTELQSRSNVALGFDISVSDYDADGSYSWLSWGPGIRKFQRSDRLGDLLLSRSESASEVKGRLIWSGDGQPAAGRRLRLRAQSMPSFWVDALSDDAGQWKVELPVGRYTIDESSVVASSAAPIDVVKEFGVERTLALREVRGHSLGVGTGTVVPAGSGDLTRGWVSFGPEDGLPFPRIDAMAEDHQGRLWLGSRIGGLCYFDGQNFVQFTTADGLPNDQVYSLATDFAGRVWIGTLQGLLYYDGTDFVAFTTRDGLIDDHVSALMVARDSTIWIGTTQGVSLYDGRRFTLLKPSDGLTAGEIYSLLEDSRGRVWIGSHLGLVYYDGSDIQPIDGELNRASVLALAETDAGQVLASTSKGLYAEKDGRFEKTNYVGMTPHESTTSMVIDRSRQVCVVIGNKIYRIGDDGVATVVEGGSNHNVRRLLAGKQGYLWAGTVQGLWRWDSETFVPYRQGWLGTQEKSRSWYSSHAAIQDLDLSGESLADVLIPHSDGGIWIAADNKLARIDRELRFSEEIRLDSTQIIKTLLEDSNGTLWIGTSANRPGEWLFSYRDGHLDSLLLGTIESSINALHEDAEGSVWIGSQSGLWRLQGDTLNRFTVNEGLSSNTVRSIASDPRGWIWIANGSEIDLYANGNIHRWRLNAFQEIQRMVSMGICIIIHVDGDGRTWFGFEGGMFALEPGIITETSFSDPVVHTDLNSSVIQISLSGPNAFAHDDRGKLLVGGVHGINIYDNMLSQNIGDRDGLDLPVIDLAPIGDKLAVLTGKGLVIFSRDEEKPRVEIQEVVGERPYDLDVAALKMQAFEPYGLSFRLPSLHFEYRGSSLKTRPTALAFQYRLLGYNDEWAVTRDARVSFPHNGGKSIEPGKYTFEVRAIDRDLMYGEPDRIEIDIIWPVWIIAQYIGLLVGICAVLAFILHTRKSAQVLGIRVEERTRELSISNAALNKRMAEQSCLYQMASVLEAPDLALAEIVDRTVQILPQGISNPDEVRVRVQVDDYEKSSSPFSNTPLQFAHRVERQQFSVEVQVAFPNLPAPKERDSLAKLEKKVTTLKEREMVVAVTEALALAIERFHAAQQLRESEDYLRSIVSYLVDGLVTVDDELRIVSFNPAAEQIFGYTDVEVISQSVDLLVPPDQNKSENLLFNIAMADSDKDGDQRQQMAEVFGQRKGGEIFPMDLAVGVFDHAEDRQLICLVRDITSRIDDQRRLNQAQKMEAIGQLASGIAHEINTPMQYISSNLSFVGQGLSELDALLVGLMKLTDSVKDGEELPPDLRSLLSIASDMELDFVRERLPQAVEDAVVGTERVSEIVQALREAAHPGTGKKVGSNINHILHNAAIVSRNSWKYHSELVEDYDESCPLVPVFVGELSQTFINLIVNAADAIEEEIERSAPSSDARGEIRLVTRKSDDFVEVDIADTGAGIPQQIQSRIFDYFFTTKAPGKGTGQGLAIVYDVIVNKHGGELSLDSVPERGTTFTVRLPISPE